MEINELIESLNKKPETFKEKLDDFWFDISVYYPSRIKDFFYDIRRFFRNLWKYRNILVYDNDFDFGYLENILYFKLEYMAKYFRTARIVESSERTYQELSWALRLGKIAFEKEEYIDNNLWFSGYVNTKNYSRFIQIVEFDLEKFENDKNYRDVTKNELRRTKARHLFYNLLRDNSEKWWD